MVQNHYKKKKAYCNIAILKLPAFVFIYMMTTDPWLTNFTTDQNFYQICLWDQINASILFAVFIKKLNWHYYKLSSDSLIKKIKVKI